MSCVFIVKIEQLGFHMKVKMLFDQTQPSLVNQTVFLCDTHACAICGQGKGRGKTVWVHLPRFSATEQKSVQANQIAIFA